MLHSYELLKQNTVMVYKVQTQIDASLMTKNEIKFMINEPWRSVRNSRESTTKKEPCNSFDTYVVSGSSSKPCFSAFHTESGDKKSVRRKGIEPIESSLKDDLDKKHLATLYSLTNFTL